MQTMHDFMQKLAGALFLTAAVFLLHVSYALAQVPTQASVKVLAASDLKFALTHIIEQYRKETKQSVVVTFGSSGNMARQIQQGLNADLFMSADEAYVQQLAQAGITRKTPDGYDAGALYALGRLALLVAPGQTLEPDRQLLGVKNGWAQVNKLAIANPEHAPYGRAARQALQALGLWDMVQPRLVLGENIAQATQFVTTGAAQVGITALSLVQAPELQGVGRYVVLPTHLHAPLRQRMVLLRAASPAAVSFYAYLQLPRTRVVLARYGFLVP
jgi:molybdate transport system substrate-binding protein